MREYNGDIRFICLEVEALAKKQSSFKILFIAQLGHTHCSATIECILDIYLWWLKHVDLLRRFNHIYVEN